MAKRTVIVIALTLALSSCGQVPLLGALGAGGTNVAANTQVGKENRQAIFSAETAPSAGRDVINKDVAADSVGSVTITNQEIPIWIIASMMLGFVMWSYLLWVLPSPDEIWRRRK